MTLRWIRTGYLLGISLILTGIIYFFASNWQGFDRLEKVLLSVGLMLLFYVASSILTLMLKRHDFLSKWLFVVATIAFGITLALIGQIYNSHADSFWLFFIWLIPSAVLAWITHYEPFRILSLFLLQLTFWFYYFPSSYAIERGQWEAFWTLITFAFINGGIYLLSRSRILPYLAYSSMQGWLFILYQVGLYERQFAWWPYIYAGLLIGSFLYYFRVKKQRSYILITGLFAGVFLINQYFRYVVKYYHEGIFLAGLFVVALIVIGSVYLIKHLRTMAQDETKGHVFLFAFQAIVTFVASVIGISSIMGLITMLTNDFSFELLFFLAVFGLVLPAFLAKRWNSVVRYTLSAIGFGLVAITSNEVSMTILFIFTLVLLFFYVKSLETGLRVLTNIAISLYSLMIILDWTDEPRLALFIVVVINAVFYFLPLLKKVERNAALGIGLSAFLPLTSMDLFSLDLWYVLSNIAFVLLVVGFIFYKHERGGMFIAWLYWWLFLVLKYYEFAWDLLDKSMSFLITGMVFLVGTALFEKTGGTRIKEQPSWLRKKALSLLAIVVLQTLFIGYLVYEKEDHLQNGDVVKLELAPIDPRSLLQGDYVRLRYEISDVGTWEARGKVKVILRKDAQGIHRFAGFYSINGEVKEGYTPQKGDVLINGKMYGDTVIYGIESYFVPEGTGIDIQQNARYAYVRVSEEGDALLEKLGEE
jgi:uncharacterized membrane-anchored protein/uncharacterized membrane protein